MTESKISEMQQKYAELCYRLGTIELDYERLDGLKSTLIGEVHKVRNDLNKAVKNMPKDKVEVKDVPPQTEPRS